MKGGLTGYKCLLSKHGEQSLNPKNTLECQVGRVACLKFKPGKGEAGEPRASWLARLAWSANSGFDIRTLPSYTG